MGEQVLRPDSICEPDCKYRAVTCTDLYSKHAPRPASCSRLSLAWQETSVWASVCTCVTRSACRLLIRYTCIRYDPSSGKCLRAVFDSLQLTPATKLEGCNKDTAGKVTYSKATGVLMVCSGVQFEPVIPTPIGSTKWHPAASCKALKAAGLTRVNCVRACVTRMCVI